MLLKITAAPPAPAAGESTVYDVPALLLRLLAPEVQPPDPLARPAEALRRERSRRLAELRLDVRELTNAERGVLGCDGERAARRAQHEANRLAREVRRAQHEAERREADEARAELQVLLARLDVQQQLGRLPHGHRDELIAKVHAIAARYLLRRDRRLAYHRALVAIADGRFGAGGLAFYPLVRAGGAA